MLSKVAAICCLFSHFGGTYEHNGEKMDQKGDTVKGTPLEALIMFNHGACRYLKNEKTNKIAAT
jgi:hypothetical protein